MKRLLVNLVLGLMLFGSTGVSRAVGPYVYLSVPQEKVNLGTVFIYDSIIPKAMTLKINSNCFHGSVIASIGSLKNSLGNEIMQDRISIKTPFTGDFISMSKPVVISGPAFGSHEVVIDFKVKANGANDRAGKYYGMIAFTVMPVI